MQLSHSDLVSYGAVVASASLEFRVLPRKVLFEEVAVVASIVGRNRHRVVPLETRDERCIVDEV